ncbi:MAG: hypothetical protein ACLGPL_09970 [Acidobacteriota bacterium]
MISSISTAIDSVERVLKNDSTARAQAAEEPSAAQAARQQQQVQPAEAGEAEFKDDAEGAEAVLESKAAVLRESMEIGKTMTQEIVNMASASKAYGRGSVTNQGRVQDDRLDVLA